MDPVLANQVIVAIQIVMGCIGLLSLLWWGVIFSNKVDLVGRKIYDHAIIPVRPRERPFWFAWDLLVFLGMLIIISGVAGSVAKQHWPAYAASMKASDDETTKVETGGDSKSAAEAKDSVDATAGGQDADLVESARGDEAPAKVFSVPKLVVGSVASLVSTLLMIGALIVRARTPFRQLGLIPQRGDLRNGLVGVVLILPPTMVVMYLVTLFVDYEHTVLDSLKANPQWDAFAAIFFVTAIVTPVFEEFMFRVVLQGGLQRMATDFRLRKAMIRGVGDEPEGEWVPVAWWPLVISSLLFAFAHVGQGLAPVPLFVMAMGMGYLYRQTGSIYPSVIVHMTLNSLTLAVTFLSLYAV